MSENENIELKLKKKLAKSGNLSSADVANFTKENIADQKETKPKTASIDKDSIIEASDPGKFDDLNSLAKEEHIKDAIDKASIGPTNSIDISKEFPNANKVKVNILASDKDAFINAAITGERMRLKFNLCNSNIVITVRNRTLPETQAIINRLRAEMLDKSILTNLDYSIRLRSMLMAAQIESFNGTDYPELAELTPLNRTKTADGFEEPGWLKFVDHWANMQEGLHGMIWNTIWEFETKYWAMVEDSKNQDFWLPEVST